MLDLAIALRESGVAAALVCPSQGALAQRGRAASMPVFGLEKRSSVDGTVVHQLARLWRDGGYDVLHAHNGRMTFHAALARAVVGRGALVATQHFLTPARAERRGLARWMGQLLHDCTNRFVTRQIAISRAVSDAMLARREATTAKLRIVHNGIRDPRSLPLVAREEIRRRYHVSQSARLIVCLARLEPEKGLDTLIRAMEIVAKQQPSACCLIAGQGRLEGRLQTQIAAMSSLSAVRLVGFVEDSLSLLAAADLCVLPSVAEPFGLSLVEAMALGVPVISTSAGGPLEIVRDGNSGYLVPPGEPAKLAAAILAVVENPDAITKMGNAARVDFLAHFTADRMARQMFAIYEEARQQNASISARCVS